MSFLFSFVHTLVCVNCKIISCKLYTYSKKKKAKSKKQKTTHTSVWVKNTKVMPQNSSLSIFFLGKGRESLCFKPYEKLSLQVHFLTCSPACTKLDKASTMHLKIAQNVYFSHEFCTFPLTEGNEIQHLYSSCDPNKKAHLQHKFREQQNYSSLWTRKSSKLDPERHKFWEPQNFSSLQARESSKSNLEKQEF